MNEDELIKALEQAHDALMATDQYDPRTFPWLFDETPSGIDSCVPGLSRLLGALRAEPTLQALDGKMQVYENVARRIDFRYLAEWLMERSEAVSRAEAVADLDRFVSTERLPCTRIWAVAGVTIAEPCDFGDGLVLRAWDQLPRSTQRSAGWTRRPLGFGPALAALTRDEEHPVRHVSHDETSPFILSPQYEVGTDPFDALLCLGLLGPAAPSIVASWLEPPAWAPVVAAGQHILAHEGSGGISPILPDHYAEAVQLFHSFRILPSARQDSLRLAMDRLNRAMRRRLEVDAAIDLGIALEVLFLGDTDDDRGELTFRLRVRGSRFASTDVQERKEVFRLLGDLYTLRSCAVHSGRLQSEIRDRTAREVLHEGYAFVARVIRRMITETPPNWMQLTLG